jgi:hypothetical protein
VENNGSQGKNRVLVITQSTLGCGLIKKTYFLKNEDKYNYLINFKFQLILWTIVVPRAKIGF